LSNTRSWTDADNDRHWAAETDEFGDHGKPSLTDRIGEFQDAVVLAKFGDVDLNALSE
jgi:hypothetical protein